MNLAELLNKESWSVIARLIETNEVSLTMLKNTRGFNLDKYYFIRREVRDSKVLEVFNKFETTFDSDTLFSWLEVLRYHEEMVKIAKDKELFKPLFVSGKPYLMALIVNDGFEKWPFINSLVNLDIVEIDELVSNVLQTRRFINIYLLAKFVDRAPLDKLTDEVIRLGDHEDMYAFALIPGVNTKKLSLDIAESLDALYIYKFAKDVKGVDINALTTAIIKTQNPLYITLYIINVGVRKEELFKALFDLQSFDYIASIILVMDGKILKNNADAYIYLKDVEIALGYIALLHNNKLCKKLKAEAKSLSVQELIDEKVVKEKTRKRHNY